MKFLTPFILTLSLSFVVCGGGKPEISSLQPPITSNDRSVEKEHHHHHHHHPHFARGLKRVRHSFLGLELKLHRTKDKSVVKIDSKLAKLSKGEQKLHNAMKKVAVGTYKFVARRLSIVHFAISVALEPILGTKLVFLGDKVVGGVVVVTKRVGKFVIDHFGVICGIAVGILVGVTVTAGLDLLTLNPIVGGAIGGAAGGFAQVVTTEFITRLMKGNLIPTSLEDAAERSKLFAKKTAFVVGTSAAAGALTGGLHEVVAPIAVLPMVTKGLVTVTKEGTLIAGEHAIDKKHEKKLEEKKKKEEKEKHKWEEKEKQFKKEEEAMKKKSSQ